MDEGTTITFVVSKGKGVLVPNLVGYTKEQLAAWQGDPKNELTVVTKSIYNELPEGSVVNQSIAPNTTVDSGSVLELTISLYLPILETNTKEWIGKNYLELKAKCDEFNSKGADIQAGEYGAFATRTHDPVVPEDGIVAISCSYGTSDVGDGCERPLNLNSRIAYQVSLGPDTSTPSPTPAPDTYATISLTKENMSSLESMRKFCNDNSGSVSCSFTPVASENPTDEVTVSSGGVELNKDVEQTLFKNASLIISYQVKGTEITTPPTEGSEDDKKQ